jgi:pentatricopeptide repeat protein
MIRGLARENSIPSAVRLMEEMVRFLSVSRPQFPM